MRTKKASRGRRKNLQRRYSHSSTSQVPLPLALPASTHEPWRRGEAKATDGGGELVMRREMSPE